MKQLLLNNEAKNKNMVFSPLSIHMLLSLVAAGSNELAKNQLLIFLQSKYTQELNNLASTLVPLFFAKEAPNGGPILSFANGAWEDKSLPINPIFNCHTRLILANALYFKGDWEANFDASRTKEKDFHFLNGSSVKTPFMKSGGRRYISVFDSLKVLKLPYKQGQDHEKCFFQTSLVRRFSSESGFLDRHLSHETVEVGAFLMPKFKFSSTFEASELLKTVGLELPFVPGGLTEMVTSPMGDNLYVSQIQHKSYIDVNEDNTEVAVVMVRRILKTSVWRRHVKRIDFVADHPFIFVIGEEITGSVLFNGQVLNPIAN
ncbi:hypothetical protein ACLB2K_045002 [Fragaria x ananassa]